MKHLNHTARQLPDDGLSPWPWDLEEPPPDARPSAAAWMSAYTMALGTSSTLGSCLVRSRAAGRRLVAVVFPAGWTVEAVSQARRDARIVAAAPRLLEFVRRAAERQDPGAAALLTSLGVPVGLTSDYRGDFESADDGP